MSKKYCKFLVVVDTNKNGEYDNIDVHLLENDSEHIDFLNYELENHEQAILSHKSLQGAHWLAEQSQEGNFKILKYLTRFTDYKNIKLDFCPQYAGFSIEDKETGNIKIAMLFDFSIISLIGFFMVMKNYCDEPDLEKYMNDFTRENAPILYKQSINEIHEAVFPKEE
jgi:hypothetical protein